MPIRILIADDHAVFRSGLRALLEKETDMQIVAEAGDGFATLRALETRQVDVLLLDITMPKLPGPQVVEQALRKWPHLAVVVLTMHEDEYYLQEMFKTGVRGFVLKKSTGTDLLQAIRAAHQGQQYVDTALAGHMISSFVGTRSGKKRTRAACIP